MDVAAFAAAEFIQLGPNSRERAAKSGTGRTRPRAAQNRAFECRDRGLRLLQPKA